MISPDIESGSGIWSLLPRIMANWAAGCNEIQTETLPYALIGGQRVEPIGDQKVDRFIWRSVDQGNLHRISAAIDPINKLYILCYPGSGSANGTPNRLLIYNWTIGRWSEAEIEA